MNAETELKFRLAPQKLASVLRTDHARARRDGSRQKLVSTYYDTNKQKLRRSGLTLRVRKIDDRYVQTVKAGGLGVTRGEWEDEIADAKPDLKKARHTPLDDVATRKLRRKLRPVFRTDVDRTARTRRLRRSEIELAVDRGRIAAGRRSRPIAELELELKSGDVADLFRLARSLERRAGAELDLRSKSERGYRLVSGEANSAQHAEPIQLSHDLMPQDAFRVIAHSAFRHFTANAEAVRELNSEAVHQMRVGLRRLRAAISLFGDILPQAGLARVKAELKWLTGELAPARESDVFLLESVRPLAGKGVPLRGARAMAVRFSAERKQAFRRAREAVSSARYRRLLIDVLEWIESVQRPQDEDRSIAAYASDLLDRRIRKARKQGRHLNDLAPRQRHKLRIKIKKIRYAVDFFESLYRERDRKKLSNLSRRLKRIQSALGSLNDFIAHRGMATTAALSAPRANRRAQAFAGGFIVGEEQEAAKRLMTEAATELGRLHAWRVEPRK